jgi:protein MpaA
MTRSTKILSILTVIVLVVAIGALSILLAQSPPPTPTPVVTPVVIPPTLSPTPTPTPPPASPTPAPAEPAPDLPPGLSLAGPFVAGYSVNREAINVYRFGVGEVLVYVLGGIHGNEPRGAELATAFLKQLSAATLSAKVKEHASFILIPRYNPDGLRAHTRVNAHGIDLNRNFRTRDFNPAAARDRHYGGTQAESEPETRAFLALVRKYKPALIYTIHQPMNLINYDGRGETIAADMRHINHLAVKANIGYATPGSLGTYFGAEREVPVITLELPPLNTPNWNRIIDLNVRAIAYSVRQFFARLFPTAPAGAH